MKPLLPLSLSCLQCRIHKTRVLPKQRQASSVGAQAAMFSRGSSHLRITQYYRSLSSHPCNVIERLFVVQPGTSVRNWQGNPTLIHVFDSIAGI
jgi:hypothetical protein